MSVSGLTTGGRQSNLNCSIRRFNISKSLYLNEMSYLRVRIGVSFCTEGGGGERGLPVSPEMTIQVSLFLLFMAL